MQRIIQINIAGRIIPIEEDAYISLKEYLNTLEKQFAKEEGKNDIIQDIENRIAELFLMRINSNIPAIDRSDVQKVIDTLGNPGDLHDASKSYSSSGNQQTSSSAYQSAWTQRDFQYTHHRLLRNPYDKVLGGVCSGIAVYFDIDPVIVRLIMVVMFLTFGIGFIAYLIGWAVIPAAKSREELYNMTAGNPVTFDDIKQNVTEELKDLKKRGEEMSRELKDFFSKKK
jgi:phage shock protein C